MNSDISSHSGWQLPEKIDDLGGSAVIRAPHGEEASARMNQKKAKIPKREVPGSVRLCTVEVASLHPRAVSCT